MAELSKSFQTVLYEYEDGSNNSGGLLPKLKAGTFAVINDTPNARLIIERKEAI